MNDQLFPDLPKQRKGPITVDGRTLAACPVCEGEGLLHIFETALDQCPRCNGGGVVLVWSIWPHPNDVWMHVQSRKEYRVLGIVTIDGTFTPAVLYQLADNKKAMVWVLPVLGWFMETSPGKPRFELISQGHKP